MGIMYPVAESQRACDSGGREMADDQHTRLPANHLPTTIPFPRRVLRKAEYTLVTSDCLRPQATGPCRRRP
jgi:hypothetical protein